MGSLICSLWDLVPWPGIEPRPPALRPPGKSPRAYLLDTTWKRKCMLFCFTTPRYLRRRRQWHPTPVLLPGKSHGRRRLEGCSPWGRWGSDMAEWLPFHFSLSCIGEGNGNPLQCSCLENPRDGGAWWAAVYGVTQSRTWLKRLSSSSRDIRLMLQRFAAYFPLKSHSL